MTSDLNRFLLSNLNRSMFSDLNRCTCADMHAGVLTKEIRYTSASEIQTDWARITDGENGNDANECPASSLAPPFL